jgi:hypothetical protein
MIITYSRAFALSLLMTVGWSASVVAQPLDEASRASARTLGRAGIEAYREKNFPLASERLERAYKVVKVPALALWSARALEKNGKLVEASERFLEATRLPANSGDQATQEQARGDAVKEREALQSRIPSLMLEVGSGVEEVRIDGVVVPIELLGVPRPVNPGAHTITASRDGAEKSEQVTISEGEKQTVRLDLPGGPARTKATAGAKVGTASKHADRDAPKPDARKGRTQRIFGYSFLGLGGAGIAVGAASGILLMSKHSSSEIKTACPDGQHCAPGVEGTVDSFNTLRTVSIVGFIVGAVGVSTGVTLLLTTPKQTSETATISPWVGLGSIGVSGGF